MKSEPIAYDFERNTHTAVGADAAFSVIFGKRRISSLLDVGCGPGLWIAAAERQGVAELHGIDGIQPTAKVFETGGATFHQAELTNPISLGRKFDAVLCTEVAEHLPRESADKLISFLCQHSDLVVFSAASPGQPGQHHVTCEWPAFWQEKFNRCGYACDDAARWELWNMDEVEPWYRQNLFLARRDPVSAGTEPRLRAVLHPAMFEKMLVPVKHSAREEMEQLFYSGRLRGVQYAILLLRAVQGKLGRCFSNA